MPADAAKTIRVERVVFLFLLLLIFWVPLPIGSNRLQPIGLLMLGTLLLGIGLAWILCRSFEARAALTAARLPLAFLGGFVVLVHLQLVPLPPAFLELIAPERLTIPLFPLTDSAAASAWHPLSIAPFETLIKAHLSLIYMVFFMSTVTLARGHRRLALLAKTLVFSGVFQAVLGVLCLSSGLQLRFLDFTYTFEHVQGTFANRNHMAAYLVICLATGIGLMLSQFGESSGATRLRQRAIATLDFLLSPKMLLRLLLVVMVVGLVLTRSRGGNSAFFTSLLIVGVLAIFFWRRMAPVTVVLITSLIVIDIVLIGSWIGLNKVVERMEQTAILEANKRGEETFEERAIAVRDILPSLQKNLLLGTGAGTFEMAFPPYRNPAIQGRYQHAHNDYVEIASDTGLLGFALLAALVLASAWRALAVMRRHPSNLARGMAFASLMAIVAMLFHATVEFNLQIPAVALTFCLMLALPWAAAGLGAPAVTARETA